MKNKKPNPKDYVGRAVEYWHARKNWLQEQKDKKITKPKNK